MRALRNLYLSKSFFAALTALCLLFVFGYWLRVFTILAWLGTVLFLVVLAVELYLLFREKEGVFARRFCRDKFSNGDDNPVEIYLESRYKHPVRALLNDELPVQFQNRESLRQLGLKAFQEKRITYNLRPLKRGPYEFGGLVLLVSTFAHLLRRRYVFDQNHSVAVYPSFLQMRHYELLAISNHLRSPGLKKVRRIGNNREFEQIERYVPGDDYRRINWKATARRHQLMVNHYQDERSQNIISVIDKGRSMKMPFAGMSLLDYAINASLVLSNIALRKGDRAGLLSFQTRRDGAVLPGNRSNQLELILEQLYREKTTYQESNLKPVHRWLSRFVGQRSLVMLYTNYESLYSLERQLPLLKMIARRHLLLVVFFKNTEIEALTERSTEDTEEIYVKGLAEDMLLEKKQMLRRLRQAGIQCLLTRPAELTASALNKYLELKSRGMV